MNILKLIANVGAIKTKIGSVLEGLAALTSVLKGVETLVKQLNKNEDVAIISKALQIASLIREKLEWVGGLVGVGGLLGLKGTASTEDYLDEVIKNLQD